MRSAMSPGTAGLTRTLLCIGMLLVAPGVAADSPTGWVELPGTAMRAVCPLDQQICPENVLFEDCNVPTELYRFRNRCTNVIAAWSGALLDTTRNRLVIFGGGHGDYLGNEIYALDLNDFTMARLTDPARSFTPGGPCVDALADGTPSSRHSYGGLAYIAHADRMFMYGGSRGCGSGGFGNDTWTFDFAHADDPTVAWTNKQPTGTNPGRSIVTSVYDEQTNLVYVRTNEHFFSYNYDSNHWERLRTWDRIDNYSHASATIDTYRNLYVVVAPSGVYTIDLSGADGYQVHPLTTTGPQTIIETGRSPGLAYDPVRDRVVAWDGGSRSTEPDTVFSLNIGTAQWQALTHDGGPGNADTRGTFGRWRWVPALGAFVVTNHVDQNSFLFYPPPADATTPAAPSALAVY